jgi:hypothetical protein
MTSGVTWAVHVRTPARARTSPCEASPKAASPFAPARQRQPRARGHHRARPTPRAPRPTRACSPSAPATGRTSCSTPPKRSKTGLPSSLPSSRKSQQRPNDPLSSSSRSRGVLEREGRRPSVSDRFDPGGSRTSTWRGLRWVHARGCLRRRDRVRPGRRASSATATRVLSMHCVAAAVPTAAGLPIAPRRLFGTRYESESVFGRGS